MELNRAARKYYTLELGLTDLAGAAVEDAGPWEASFDGGVTWATGAKDTGTGFWEWLVAGPLVDNEEHPPEGVALAAVLSAWTTQPIVRLVDNPEILAEDAPPIEMHS